MREFPPSQSRCSGDAEFYGLPNCPAESLARKCLILQRRPGPYSAVQKHKISGKTRKGGWKTMSLPVIWSLDDNSW